MKICIILSHHYVDDTVSYRFENLKKLNPDCDIFSVGLSGYDLLSQSIVIDRNLWPSNNNIKIKTIDWSLGDLCLYQTYINYPNYDIYFLLEYDTAFNVPVLEFFPNITSQDCGMNYGPDFDVTKWYWYNEKYDPKLISKEYLASTGPTTCLWFHNHLLSQISHELMNNVFLYNNMFSELRLGTLTKKFTNIKLNKPKIFKYISYLPSLIEKKQSVYFYHPCKELLMNE